MNYKQNLFNVIKMLVLMIIVVETATVKMLILPSSLNEYIYIHAALKIHLEHIILSIVFTSLGALIFLKKS